MSDPFITLNEMFGEMVLNHTESFVQNHVFSQKSPSFLL